MNKNETRKALKEMLRSLSLSTAYYNSKYDCTMRGIPLEKIIEILNSAIKELEKDDMHEIKCEKNDKKSMAVMFKYISGYKMMLEDVDSVHTTADRIVIVHTDGEVNTLMKENVIYFTLCIQ